jgi:hypothetical protein
MSLVKHRDTLTSDCKRNNGLQIDHTGCGNIKQHPDKCEMFEIGHITSEQILLLYIIVNIKPRSSQ